MWGIKSKFKESKNAFEYADRVTDNEKIDVHSGGFIDIGTYNQKENEYKIQQKANKKIVKEQKEQSRQIESKAKIYSESISYIGNRLPNTPKPKNTTGVFKRNRSFEL